MPDRRVQAMARARKADGRRAGKQERSTRTSARSGRQWQAKDGFQGAGSQLEGVANGPAWPVAASAQRFEKGWRQIHQARRGIDTLADKTIAGKFEEQGYVDGSVVKENTVSQFAVVAQGFAVIGGDSDQRIVIQPLTPQIVKQLTYNIIRVSDTPVVRGVRKPAAERFGWTVGVVRVPQVKPQEKRTTVLLVEPFEHVSQGHLAAALHGSLAALPGLLPVKACVVDIEASLESGGKPVFGVKDDAADKGPRVVTLGVENFR